MTLKPSLSVTPLVKGGTKVSLERSNAKWSLERYVFTASFFGAHSLLTLFPLSQLFNVGSGLTDKIRKNPPKIGTIITYRFQELTRDGVPR